MQGVRLSVIQAIRHDYLSDAVNRMDEDDRRAAQARIAWDRVASAGIRI